MIKPKHAEFVTSAAGPEGFPPPGAPELAFAGRSNVGKSSLLNALIGRPLARTSASPGRTRLVNFFRVEPSAGPVVFADLPGYGYAKVPMALRASWRPMVEAYLTGRATLRGVLLLVDARRGVEREELELAEWLASIELPLDVVVTKADKLPKSKRWPVGAAVRRELGLAREPVLASSQSGDGIDALWKLILKRAAAPAARGA